MLFFKKQKLNRIKLRYDFNETRSCEIKINGEYYRVTPDEFRSFGGERRILNINDSSNIYYEKYEGPVYYFRTNKVVPKNEVKEGFNFLHQKDPRTPYINQWKQ